MSQSVKKRSASHIYLPTVPLVAGISTRPHGGENHMWALDRIDGQWLYFDPTSDQGRAVYGFSYCGIEAQRYWSDQRQGRGAGGPPPP